MFKKLITLMLALSIFTVQAHASTEHGLKAAFDELNYSLTTEWDQKDQAFYDAQINQFTATLRQLQAEGLTHEQMIEFAKAEIKNDKVANDFDAAMKVIKLSKMSDAEASQYLVETMKKSYSAGASWVGEVAIGLGILIVIIAWGTLVSDCDTDCSGGIF